MNDHELFVAPYTVNRSLENMKNHHMSRAQLVYYPLHGGFASPNEAVATLLGNRQPTEAWRSQWFEAVDGWIGTAGSESGENLHNDPAMGRAYQEWKRQNEALSHTIAPEAGRVVSSLRLRCPLPGGAPHSVSQTFLRIRGHAGRIKKYEAVPPVLTHRIGENNFTVTTATLTLDQGAHIGPALTLDPHHDTQLANTLPTLPAPAPNTNATLNYFELAQFDCLLPVEVDFISRSPLSGNISNLGRQIAESSPAPSVDLQITDTELSGGELSFTVRASVRDTLAELTGSSVQSLQIFIDGALRETVSLGNPSGTIDPIWAPNPGQYSVERTYTIPRPAPSGHVVRVQTTENALGNLGWDQSSILLKKSRVGLRNSAQPASTITGLPTVQLQLPLSISATVADTISASIAGSNATLTETGVATRLFAGQTAAGIGVRFQLGTAPVLSSAVDQISGILWLRAGTGDVRQFAGTFVESGATTRSFSPALIQYTDDSRATNLTLVGVVNGSGSPSAILEPFVARIALPQSIADGVQQGQILKAKVGGQLVSLVRDDAMQVGQSASGGKTYLYLADGASPKVFAAIESMPSLCPGADFAADTLAFELVQAADTNAVVYDASASLMPVNTLAASPSPLSPGPPAPYAGGPMASTQSQSYTLDEVLVWYEILFGEYGMQVLKVYQDLGDDVLDIRISDLNDASDWDDYEIDNWLPIDQQNGNTCLVLIDNDQKSPVQAAMSLYYALHELESSFTRDDVRLAQFENALAAAISADGGNEETWRKLANFQMEAIGGALQTCYDAAAMGLSVANEGASWVLTLNDASDDWKKGARWTAAAMVTVELIPFISGRLVKTGKKLIVKRLINGQEFELTAEAAEAIGKMGEELRIRDEALDQLPEYARADRGFIAVAARLRMMDHLRPLIQANQVHPDVIDALFREGMLTIDDAASRAALRETLVTRLGGNPGRTYSAHHDLPLQFTEIFIKAGIDPNDFRYGRLVEQVGNHAGWHNPKGFRAASGGPFNQIWREFLADSVNQNASSILTRLQDIRSGKSFTVTKLDGTTESYTFAGGLIPLP